MVVIKSIISHLFPFLATTLKLWLTTKIFMLVVGWTTNILNLISSPGRGGKQIGLTGFVIVVVQDNQKSSRTTKYESSEHFGCPYGQPHLSQKQFCHWTRWHICRTMMTRSTRQSSVISEKELTWIMSAVMCVWLLTMPCGRNAVFKF